MTLTAQATDLVEFNDTAVLTCSASSGTSLSYAWLNGSNGAVSAIGQTVQLGDRSANLTFRVTRYDKGPFFCNVSNGISLEVSAPAYLKISCEFSTEKRRRAFAHLEKRSTLNCSISPDGPSNTAMALAPAAIVYGTGDNITLSCSADSSPPARMWWTVNGMELNKTASVLQLQNVAESNSGNYTCNFYNNVTSRFASESKMIKILGESFGVCLFVFLTLLSAFLRFWRLEHQTKHHKSVFFNYLYLVRDEFNLIF